MGKAKNLKKRVSSYFQNSDTLGEKTSLLISQTKKIKVTVVESELESLLLEASLIKKHVPKYNVRLTDGKAFLLIRITLNDKYPKILFARREDDLSSYYFGPYPNSKALKVALKAIRKIFPYQSSYNHPKKPCLYYHLGLCPCPAVFDSEKLKKQYKKNVQRIIIFLSGKKRKVLKDLEKERDSYGKKEQFEEAKKVQEKIAAINYITSPIRKPFEYEINPNLSSDLRIRELTTLKKALEQAGIPLKSLTKIECYDISNTAGAFAVGSMVVFKDGEKDSSSYRRFKIRKIKGPNDFAMMEEVLTRRLKHAEWGEYPDLIIVDGGKGQVSSAQKALKKNPIQIPLIGLAKREETIITADFKEISLPKTSEALYLVQRIRDEAHRFAIMYHRKLRSKYNLV